MKTTTLGIAIGTAIAALGLAITAVPEAKAGGVYWNNNGGGGVVINRGTTYGPRGYYNYGPNYFRTITEVGVLLQVPMVPVLAVTTVVVDASVTDPSIDSKSSHFTPSALAGFSIERNSSDQPG